MHHALLIEPVWNRNGNKSFVVDLHAVPFNRTSMESKPDKADSVYYDDELLIEPVWNRNRLVDRDIRWEVCLLIEPVWNRNGLAWIIAPGSFVTFNRTSMESKQYYLRG